MDRFYTRMERHVPNFQTDHMLIIRYNVGAGGKFIAGCLSLSHGVIPPDTMLAEKEINGQLTKQQLQQTLLQRSLDKDGKWNDFGFSDKGFWGFDKFRYFEFDVGTMGLLEWNPLIPDLTQRNDRWLCNNVHSYGVTMKLSEAWPNATILFIDNATQFKTKFRPQKLYGEPEWGVADHRINIFWKNCRGSDWPFWPPRSREEYDNLPSWIKNEIKTLHQDEILKYFHDSVLEREHRVIEKQKQAFLMNKHPSIVWDADWFCDARTFADKSRWLYQQLGLVDYDESLVMGFYQGWISAMQQELEIVMQDQTGPGNS